MALGFAARIALGLARLTLRLAWFAFWLAGIALGLAAAAVASIGEVRPGKTCQRRK
jgi:hypothetical protein